MAKRQLFSVDTPLGYKVVLTRDRWRQIIRFKHPAVKHHEAGVRECLATPVIVRASAKDADVHLYYRKVLKRYLCTVVAPAGPAGSDYFVVTAYFTNRVKQGQVLWTK